jgi:hypothetical protein
MSGLSTASLNAQVAAQSAQGAWISAHTADPGSSGANEVSGAGYARVQTTWGSATAGVISGSQVNITIPTGVTVTWGGVWSASSGGTWLGTSASAFTGQAFPSGGTLQLTPTLTTAQG